MVRRDKIKSAIPLKEWSHVPGESAEERHKRRLNLALRHSDRLNGYCKHKGYKLTIDGKNEDTCFVIERQKLHIDWYPFSAKMIVNYQNKHGIHVHEVSQIISYLEFAWLLFGGKNGGFF